MDLTRTAPGPAAHTMTSALVLGGGGPLGIAWQAGLLTGLTRRGLDPARADLVLGTSAGSIVGAALTAGLDLTTLADQVGGQLPIPPDSDGGITGLMELTAQTTSPARTIERVTGYALAADTLPEADYLDTPLFATFEGVPWPAGFHCTTIDIDTGRLQVWDAAAGAPLAPALAASCAVPGLFPPVTIAEHRHIDGGMLSPLNAELAAGHPHIVIVSCFALTPPGASPGPAEAAARQLTEIDRLRTGGSEVTCIEPGQEFLAISNWGADIMSTTHAAQAYEAGLRQADTAALPPSQTT